MQQLGRFVGREEGHVGPGIASLLALAGAILLPIGLSGDSDGLSIAGAALLGLGVIVGANAPHLWARRIYRRLDRMAPDDPDAHTGSGLRIEF
ncbi:MAG: hypothetical protein A2148_05780 [Chloroflexi bacterium RBG_16_68_14]|nr:MAG: hypothetical protein A2148_05780 [Chloroflexi bacterium RBG_16_68_14]